MCFPGEAMFAFKLYGSLSNPIVRLHTRADTSGDTVRMQDCLNSR